MMKTCLACMTTYPSIDEMCPQCECPMTIEEFTDPSGEQQDNALRRWFELVQDAHGLVELSDWYNVD